MSHTIAALIILAVCLSIFGMGCPPKSRAQTILFDLAALLGAAGLVMWLVVG